MSKSTFKILFYLRKNYLNKEGKAGIMIRLSLNGEISQFSSKLDIEPDKWDTTLGKAKGNTQKARQLNETLEDIRASLKNHYRDIEVHESFVTVEKIRNAFLGITAKQRTLLELFKKHNEDARKLVGISKTPATLAKYDRCYRRLEEFMKVKYNISDISLKEIGHMFITDFENYLRTESKCNENTTAKFMQTFKMIVIIAKNNGWIYTDPFSNYKIRLKRVDRGYLTDAELQKIMKKKFPTKSGKIGVCCYIKRAEESVRYTHSVVFILHWISINYGMPYIGFRFKIGACCYTCVKRYQTSIRNRSMLLQS